MEMRVHLRPTMIPVIALLLVSNVCMALANSPCPPRQSIYPCSCVHFNKKFTAVTCHRLPNTDALLNILPFLRTMHIDQFHIYDSFWGANESQRVFPTDWLALTKIKQLEIVDTPLADRFMCSWSVSCKNSVMTRFVAINSTQSSSIALCPTKDGKSYPWTGCMEKMTDFQISYGKLQFFTKRDIFQIPMNNVTTVNLTRNQIGTIDEHVFKNLPFLSKLDLSHNFIQHLDDVFSGNLNSKLIFMDLSFNSIKTLGVKLFPSFPLLNTFKAESNKIVVLNERDWIKMPESLKKIHLENNPIHCDCTIRWVNGTSFQKAVKNIHCETPTKYQNMNFKNVVQGMFKSCDKDEKKKKTLANKLNGFP